METTELNTEGAVSLMQGFLEQAPLPPKEGDIIEGTVLALDRARLYIDLPPFGTGVIYGREYMNAREVIKRTNIGDTVQAKVTGTTKDGYIELSLKEARQAVLWAEAEEAVKQKMQFELPVKEANKGGLILEWQGIAGFLPASQLKAEHYPRVNDGDKDKILEELRKLVGEKLTVSMIGAQPKEGKLIFIEQALKTRDYVRVRVGISGATPSGKLKRPPAEKLAAFVLGKFRPPEQEKLKKAKKLVKEAIELIATESVERAQTEINAK